ncbi:adenylate cyclase [Scheffersomyces coipomensis]|uniref:adenylate cyclase n=1 Tax=Scheffersomyces coipomensis TaxID=1788519 RepID=UPI00315C9AFA
MSFLRRDRSKVNLKPSSISLTPAAGQSGVSKGNSPEEEELPLSPTNNHSSSASITSNNHKVIKRNSSGALASSSTDKQIFNNNFDISDIDGKPPTKKNSITPSENYSPRSSVISLTQLHHSNSNHSATTNDDNGDGLNNLKDDYKGFHANKRPTGIANVPPLSQPIKPRFKKKSNSLLGKLMYNRKDSDTSNHSDHSEDSNDLNSSHRQSHSTRTPSAPSSLGVQQQQRKSTGSSTVAPAKHKFRIPSISLDHHHHTRHHHSHQPSVAEVDSPDSTEPETIDKVVSDVPSSTEASTTSPPPPTYDLNLSEMQGIVEVTDKNGEADKHTEEQVTSNGKELITVPSSLWKAPDSWDVKVDKPVKDGISVSDSDDTDDKGTITERGKFDLRSRSSSPTASLISTESHEHHKLARPHLPNLYGTHHSSHVVQTDPNNKGPNHIVRVFREDNTFTTILCPLETTTSELLKIVQRKFFLESISNYQISVCIGNCVKVLESFEQPLKIQMGLLLLSGYNDSDNLKLFGREDLSFVCKFVVENVFLRNLTHDEEAMLSKDYVDVNISGLNLKNIPNIFHQHTYEIEKLNVADNPAIYIPLDFIQSCNNLTSIDFSRNGCSKFPLNFLEAKKLIYLNLEKNFLDELPSKFSHLKNLTHLKLNSNQLSSLPKSFARLKNLESLNLSSNYFHSYPEAISELSNLRDLDLSYNDLSEVPESISKLSKLSKLNLSTNKLSKTLPKYFETMTSLKRLDIRYNQLSNVDVLGSLPLLEVTYASKNMITTFSDKMESLRLLHFDRNPITNLQFENLLELLTILDLSKAKITSIPAEFISKIPNVEKFVLDKNHLVNLPNEIANLSKLASLSVYSNNLQVLPSNIGQLTSLQYLDLHSNNLQTLPDDIWNLKSLSVLNIASNILTSFPKPPLSVAKKISSTVNFRNVDIGYKSLTEDTEDDYNGSSSSSIDLSSSSSSLGDSLFILTLADNRLTDECFSSISFMAALKSLNLSYNDIIEVPEGALRRLVKLNELYLSGNELTTLPAEDLESLKTLKLLYINNNKLVTLPAELSKITNLQHLDVGSNQLKYNISNWPYDWNWHWNKNLKYLNFSGNKRFEIKQSHVKNPETGEDFDSLLVLKNLKVLGLIDITLTTTSVPDQSADKRIRTTASESENIGYGVSDSMGMREFVSNRDVFIQKFRGNENEVLICSFDGKRGVANQGHRISSLTKNIFVPIFTTELNKVKDDSEIQDAIRKTFLALNKEVNGILSSKKINSFNPNPQSSKDALDLNLTDDGNAGCAVTLIYIKDKKLYTANIGDIEALLSRTNGDHVVLTNKHDPTNRSEFERIRASGGYVSGDGALDGDLPISRGVGFFNYLPHTHSGPDIFEMSLTTADDMIIVATRVLWEYVSYEFAVDILRQEKDDPMIAAQRLRDYAICYGATDKIAVIVVTLGEQKTNRSRFGSNALYNNLGREGDLFGNKKRRDRPAVTGDSSLRRLEEEIEAPVGELALVFTDIKNSTLLWDTYPAPMRSAIKTHNSIMRRQLRIVGGFEVKTEGDAFMVSFPSPTAALLWCFNVQQNLLTADWPSEILETDQCCEVADGKGNIIFRGLSVRMGIHWGSPVCESDVVTGRMDYFGPMVNRTSRISAVADGGQIAVSSDFLDEMGALYKIHENIENGNVNLSEAYSGNLQAGEIIERELASIEENGCEYFRIGEKKLKGLETPEPITLVYTKKLKLRYEFFQKRLSQSEESEMSTRIVGALPVEAIYGLRTISLRLENICSTLNGSHPISESFQNSSVVISEKMNTTFKESDLIGLLNHIVTRIETCTATLYVRQQMSVANGDGAFEKSKPITKIMDELNEIIQLMVKLKEENKLITN